MARPALQPGEHGRIAVEQTASGRWKARCRYLDREGRYQWLRPTRESEVAAREAVEAELRRLFPPCRLVVQEASQVSVDGLGPWSPLTQVGLGWLQERQLLGSRRPGTEHENRRLLTNLIGPALGHVPVAELTRPQVYAFWMGEAQRAPRQANTMRFVLSGTCEFAVRLGLCEVNVADALPRTKGGRKEVITLEVMALTLEQLQQVIVDYGERDGRMGPKPSDFLLRIVTFMLQTGARVSEACGARWVSLMLDGDDPTFIIDGKVAEGRGQAKAWEPVLKTLNGRRVIHIAHQFAAELNQWRADGNPFVFHTQTGAPAGMQDVHRALRRVRTWAGISGEMVPHVLRKTATTAVVNRFGLEAGQRFAGHGSTAITEGHYWARPVDSGVELRQALESLR